MDAVSRGEIAPAVAAERVAALAVEAVTAAPDAEPFARLDHHRRARQGHPEVVFAEGKTAAQVVQICDRLRERAGAFLVTRASPDVAGALLARFPGAAHSEVARTVHLAAETSASEGPLETIGPIAVVSAGTADLPVAEEAAVTAEALGNDVERLYDVGVAGLHRLLERTDVLRRAAVTIVVAGMEGALPSVVGGLVAGPVIAVPTSVGYGASFGGLAALLSMLTSCAAGLTVVNIDNGFGAAFAATRINQIHRHLAGR